ncbi:MAG: hypothetical protein LUE26_02950 [Alistipes sp.]|nr:hypothetical protein [Alistipes sp.]
MKKINISYLLALASASVIITGCMDFQKPYDYDDSPGISNEIDMTPWEFITTAEGGVFDRFIEAVEYAGIDPSEFDEPGLTIFPIINQAVANNPGTGTGTNRFPGGYWYMYQVNGIKPESWSAYPKEQVRQFVMNHIMKYPVSYDEFLSQTGGAKTFYPTKATNGYGYISLHMLTYDETDGSQGSDIIKLWVNDFPSHYTKDNPAAAGHAMHISPRTSNIKARNGSYIHIMEHFLDFPTDEDLRIVPIYNP